MKCPNCGIEVSDGSADCPKCQIFFAKWKAREDRASASAGPAPANAAAVPFFHGLACMTWSKNRVYRVYARPGELVFIWAADGSSGEAAMAARAGGLLGSLIISALGTSEEQNEARRKVLDNSRLEDLLNDNEHNFCAGREDISEASLGPRSAWLALAYSQFGHKGVFRFRHRTKGAFRLCIQTEEEVRVAAGVLPSALGGVLKVEL